jgi:hypothetical protein
VGKPNVWAWLVKRPLGAHEIRAALLPNLDFQDRLFICELGSDAAEFNALPTVGRQSGQLELTRNKSRMLTAIFARNGQSSRLLKAASVGSLQSV